MTTQGTGSVGSFDYVPAAELDRAPVRVARSPLPTVFWTTRDALCNGRRGTPRDWCAAALSGLRRRDAVTLAPLTDPRCSGWPGLLAANDDPSETLDEALDRVGSTPGSALLEALESDPDVAADDPLWKPVQQDPDRWLRAYVDAVHRGWQGVEPLWRRSTGLLDQEVSRINAAIDRGVPVTALVTDIGPRVSLVDAALRLPTTQEPRRLTVPDAGVIFSPMIAGPGCGILSTPGDRLVRMVYAVPGAWRAFDGQAAPAASLDALVGVHRSRLLRRLDHPLTAGELSAALDLRPSGMTFHLRALEAAGLIVRERRGRNVVVHRTERGSVLLALYEST
jgi:DNA-binding transcriptional ArsR family regulator